MFDEFSDGYCPQCLLEDARVPLKLNHSDFWECPDCHLQARSNPGVLVILRTRGSGDLRKEDATSVVIGWFLGKAKGDDPIHSSSQPVTDEADLRDFLANCLH